MDTEIKTNKSRYKIGMRTFKTSLAVFCCLFLKEFIGETGVIQAAISAMICMKATQTDTIKTGVVRIIGTIIGGSIGYIYLLLQNVIHLSADWEVWIHYITIPIFIIVCIYLCNLLKVQDASTICSVVFLLVVLGFVDGSKIETINYVVLRVVATLLGIVITMLINRFISPYKPEEEKHI